MSKNIIVFISSTPSFPNAKCAEEGVNPEAFFPNSNEELERDLPMLRKICQSCDHQVECLRYGVNNYEEHGVWGGLSPQDRERIWASRGNKRQRRVSHSMELGRKASELRTQGWNWDAIASRIGTTPAYAERLVYRWRKKTGVA